MIEPLVARVGERLRARGVPISVTEVIDAHLALELVGLADRRRALSSLRATLVKHAVHDPIFDEVVHQLIDELSAIDLASVRPEQDSPDVAFDGQVRAAPPLPDEAERRRLLDDRDESDPEAAEGAQRAMRSEGPDAGEAAGLDDLELDLAGAVAAADRRWHLLRTSPEVRPEDVLPVGERTEIERAARTFVAHRRRDERRWGAAPAGRLDVRSTVRTAQRTGGVPMVLKRRGRVRRAPKVLVLADVSVSVRPTARLALHTADALTRRSRGVRLLVFVDTAVDATSVVRRLPPDGAVTVLLDGGLVDVGAPSDYGAALLGVQSRVGTWMRRGATVIVFGDGRGNGADPGFEIVENWMRRVREVHWCTPEPVAAWPLGFGEMQGYADRITAAHHVRSVADVVTALTAR